MDLGTQLPSVLYMVADIVNMVHQAPFSLMSNSH